MGRRGTGAGLTGAVALAGCLHGGPAAPPPVAGELAWPVLAPVTSAFGPREGRFHDGIDLSVPDDTPVRAAAAGQVVYAGQKLRGYGKLVILRHDAHVMTVYAHNSALLVAEGEGVGRGAVIARSGHSGRATAPHLHFEVRVDGKARDPLPFLPRLLAFLDEETPR